MYFTLISHSDISSCFIKRSKQKLWSFQKGDVDLYHVSYLFFGVFDQQPKDTKKRLLPCWEWGTSPSDVAVLNLQHTASWSLVCERVSDMTGRARTVLCGDFKHCMRPEETLTPCRSLCNDNVKLAWNLFVFAFVLPC